MSPPTAEGGRLRAQDLRTSGDPLGLSGAVIRIDPDTGAGVPGNPLFSARMRTPAGSSPTACATRSAWRSGPGRTSLGRRRRGKEWEEIDRLQTRPARPSTSAGPATREAWTGRDSAALRYPPFDQLNLNMCESLYSEGTAAAPYWAYRHRQKIVAGEACDEQLGSATAGLAFVPASGGSFPPAYEGALLFADNSRQMHLGR